MDHRGGVLLALLSSALGGGAAVATRFLVGGFDPVLLAAVRFGGGALLLLPLALLLRPRWPAGRDVLAVAALGFAFYGVFIVIYNLSLSYTSVARGTLALSTLPLTTMAIGAVLGLEALTLRKSAGIVLAMGGVAVALAASLQGAPEGAWRGDLLMAGGTVCMALYNVFARPYVARSSAMGFLVMGMAAGGGALILICLVSGSWRALETFDGAQALAGVYLAAGGGALGFWLWVVALRHASPTQVAGTIAVNPLIGMVAGVLLLGEPVTLPLVLGLVAVFAGIWVSTTGEGAS
ncbi:MAG: DMT family transporter [Reyranella sp.]|nr:DMT family transporter [Reyranella sp.]